MFTSTYTFSEFLLQKETEQIVGHSKPHRGADNQHLLKPGGECSLDEREHRRTSNKPDFRALTLEDVHDNS